MSHLLSIYTSDRLCKKTVQRTPNHVWKMSLPFPDLQKCQNWTKNVEKVHFLILMGSIILSKSSQLIKFRKSCHEAKFTFNSVALHDLMWICSEMVTMNVTLNINEGNRTAVWLLTEKGFFFCESCSHFFYQSFFSLKTQSVLLVWS